MVERQTRERKVMRSSFEQPILSTILKKRNTHKKVDVKLVHLNLSSECRLLMERKGGKKKCFYAQSTDGVGWGDRGWVGGGCVWRRWRDEWVEIVGGETKTQVRMQFWR